MEDSHELDLTYVTERIIAVSFPASCSEESYLHSLQEVTRMLKCKHGDNYLVSGADSHGVADGLEDSCEGQGCPCALLIREEWFGGLESDS